MNDFVCYSSILPYLLIEIQAPPLDYKDTKETRFCLMPNNGHCYGNKNSQYNYITSPVLYSVPQGSVLRPIQFISYSVDVVIVFNANLVHIFANDKQLFISAPVAEAYEVKKAVSGVLLLSRIDAYLVGCDWTTERQKSSALVFVVNFSTSSALISTCQLEETLSGRQLFYVTWVCS